ncbi:hypothetical protein I4U23_008653 [Adineta vaga]|nr:hypothetical protein I4U23_008653 [Adineta vaga]
MEKPMRTNRERDPSPPSLLIAAHCSTIRRKPDRLDTKELSAILDDLVRELNSSPLRLTTYLNSLNESVKTLNATFPPALLKIPSHYFFTLVRNRMRHLLEQLCATNRLNDQEIYVLRNCAILLHDLVERADDVSKLLHWVTDASFLDSLGNCLHHMNKIFKTNQNRNIIKQLTRLLSLFCNVQERLPLSLHQALFERLLQPTINCLTSSHYVKLFQNLKCDTSRFTEEQKLYLIRCPHFLTSYNGPYIERLIEQILEKMLPRYVSILNKHMKTVNEWHRPMMRAVHNLIITIIYAEDYFSSHIKNEPFRALIDHLLQLLNEPVLINKINPETKNMESLLVDATLIVFSILVYEPDALEYMKQRNAAETFRKLSSVSSETIVLNSYMLLAYTMTDNDINTSQDDLPKLLATTTSLLDKSIQTREESHQNQSINPENVDRNILQLVETLKGLAYHDQIKTEILNQGLIPILYDYYEKLHGLSKEVILECIWTLSFNDQIAQHLREHSQFIHSMQSIPRIIDPNAQQNTIRRSHSYSSLRNSGFTVSNEATSNGIRKIADGILWKLSKELPFRKLMAEKTQQQQHESSTTLDNLKNRYDMMISYAHNDKEIVYRIQQYLIDHGHHIWFDRSHSHRKGMKSISTLGMEAVAEAIENSDFIILCISDSYKRDNYCRVEAEYAFSAKRTILTLNLRSGFKPDEWLTPIVNSSIYIDFAASEFKVAAKSMLKEVKDQQQLHKRKSVDVKSKPPTLTNNAHNPPILLPVVDKPYIPNEFSRPNVVHSFASTVYQPSIIHKQQLQQQPPQIPRHQNSNSSPLGFFPNAAPFNDNKVQRSEVPMQFVARSSTFGSLGSMISGPLDKDQQQASMRSLSRSPMSGSMFANPSVDASRHERSAISVHNISRSSTYGSIGSATSGCFVKEQQNPIQSNSRSQMHISSSATANAVIHKQQQQYQQQYHHQQQQQQHSEALGRSLSRSSTPGSVASGTFPKEPGETSRNPRTRSPALASGTPTMPQLINGAYQQEHQTSPRSLSASPVLSFFSPHPSASATVDKHQQQAVSNTRTAPLTNGMSLSMTSLNTEQQHQQQTTLTSVSVPSAVSLVYEKQQAHISLYSSHQPSISPLDSTNRHIDHNQQSQIPNSKSPSRDHVSSEEYVNDERQEQQQQRHYQSSRPASQMMINNGTVRSNASVNTETQRQSAQIQTLSRSSTSDSVSSDISVTLDESKTAKYSIIQPSITNNVSYAMSTNINEQQQKQSLSQQFQPTSLQSSLQSSLLSMIDSENSSTGTNNNDKQRPQTQMRSLAQAPVVIATFGTPTNIFQKTQQTLRQLPPPPSLSNSNKTNGVPIISNKQQLQQQQISRQPHLQAFPNGMTAYTTESVFDKRSPSSTTYHSAQTLNNGTLPSTGFPIDDKQYQQARIFSLPRSATIDSIPTAVNNKPQQQQKMQHMQRNPVSQPPKNNNTAFASTPVVADMPPRAPTVRVVVRPPLPNITPSNQSNNTNRQQQTNAQSTFRSTVPTPTRPALLVANNQQTAGQPISRTSTDDKIPFSITNSANKPQEQGSIQSMSQTSTSVSTSMPSTVTDVDKKQEQSVISKSNSRPTSPVTLPIPPTLKTVAPTVSSTTGTNQFSLPEEYINRKTDNSSYRNLSINAWRPTDVLDFLSDLNLFQMMPLCEAMSGKALTRLFRMCQTKPSRLYDQLNEELRTRYKGTTLPMGVYTQFLIEMDGVVGPAPDSLLSLSPTRPSVVERVILAPRSGQQEQQSTTSTQVVSTLNAASKDSSNGLRSVTPSETGPRTTTPSQTRIVERAVFRPASAAGRPYDFIVESVEESTELLQQVARYGSQLLSFDDVTRQ